jgi:hypothetical protein
MSVLNPHAPEIFSKYEFLCNQSQNITIWRGWLYELLRVHFFLFSNFCSGITDNGEVRLTDMLVSEDSNTQFGEFYVITVVWYAR